MTERQTTPWELGYRNWDPATQPLREALTTLANGYFATRGAAEESRAGGCHYPGTYLAGGYNRLKTEIAGKLVENEDLVNWPNWLPLTFRCDGEDWFNLDQVGVLDYAQRLDLARGVLTRRVRFRDQEDRQFLLESRRIVHMEDPHAAAIEWSLTPIDWSGVIEIRSAIDGRVINRGVERYRDLDGHHLEPLDRGRTGEDAVFMLAETRQSQIRMAQAVRTRVFSGDEPAAIERRTDTEPAWIAQHIEVKCEPSKPIRVEKILSLYTSRDFAISEPKLQVCKQIHRLPCFSTLLERHEQAWRRIWRHADFELGGRQNTYEQLVLRLHVFHMLQTASPNTIGGDVGIPARGLHGEAYRGHIFWDELFAFPFLNLQLPELSRSLLLYRYRRLGEARHAAQEAECDGAMFPWQSGSDGREESQVLHLNPRSGRWIPDNTHRQRHVNAAIAYNVWQYYQATGDIDFLESYGAEMLLEIARLWADLAEYHAERDRYEIRGIVGPDEFHTQYPGSDGPGIDNNAYTNVMAAWTLQIAYDVLDIVARDRRAELLEVLHIDDGELRRWHEIGRRIYVPFHGDRIISQFEGWDELEELDWDRLVQRHGDIQRLDRLLEAEGDDVNRYKASKQADVLMLFFLFSGEELGALFRSLGYELDEELIPRNIDYYLARTSHGSTLSRIVHAWVLTRRDRRRSWHLFSDALASDIDDIQGGTTAEGIHMGAMAGTVDLIQRCYTGLEMRDEVLWLNPHLPDQLGQLKLSVRYRGHWLALEITHEKLVVKFEKGWSAPARVGFAGTTYDMEQGQTISFDLEETP